MMEMTEMKELNHLRLSDSISARRLSNSVILSLSVKEKCQWKQWMRSKNEITYLEVGEGISFWNVYRIIY